MTQDEQLRLWAYQWATRGKPELPDGWKLYIASPEVRAYYLPSPLTHIPQPEDRFSVRKVDLRKFVVLGVDTVITCHVGCDWQQQMLIVTPPETQPWYDLPTAQPEIDY